MAKNLKLLTITGDTVRSVIKEANEREITKGSFSNITKIGDLIYLFYWG